TTIMGIIIAKILQRLPSYAPEKFVTAEPTLEATSTPVSGLDKAEEVAVLGQPMTTARRMIALGIVGLLIVGMTLQIGGFRLISVPSGGLFPKLEISHVEGAMSGVAALQQIFSDWLIPLLMLAIVLFGFGRQVKVYEAFIAGAKEGFQIAITIIPFL